MMNQQSFALVSEGILLYIGIPLLVYLEILMLPKIMVLLLVAGYCGFRLWRDANFAISLFGDQSNRETSKSLLIRFSLVGLSMIGLMWIFHPDQFFVFPAERPFFWMLSMVLYPVFSALPQEFIYRTYFFHRYDSVTSLKFSTLLLSALAFAFLHIVYDNWWAVGLSFIAGLLFGVTYSRTESLFWVAVEHTLYGWLAITLGFSTFFHESM